MKMRFLLDENLSPRIYNRIIRIEPTIDIVRVGHPDAPPFGTLDPDILQYLEIAQRSLITDNRRSMPLHVADHSNAGGHHWGIFLLRPDATLTHIIEEIVLLWSASEAEEWIDQVRWIPL